MDQIIHTPVLTSLGKRLEWALWALIVSRMWDTVVKSISIMEWLQGWAGLYDLAEGAFENEQQQVSAGFVGVWETLRCQSSQAGRWGGAGMEVSSC